MVIVHLSLVARYSVASREAVPMELLLAVQHREFT